MLRLLRRQRSEIAFAQADHQEVTTEHVVGLAVFAEEESVGPQTIQLALLVADDADAIFKRINTFGHAADSLLQ